MKVEMNKKNKIIALMGFVIFVALACAIIFGGSAIAKSGSMNADANTAVVALKAHLNTEKGQKAIELNVDNAFCKSTDTDITLKYMDKNAYTKLFGTPEDGEEIENSIKAQSVVYLEYSAVGYTKEDKSDSEKYGADKFIAYVCEDDIVVIARNELDDGTAFKIDANGVESALVMYARDGSITVNYSHFSDDGAALLDFPNDTSDWKKIDEQPLTELVRVKQ